MTDAKPDVGALVREIEFTMPQNKDMACGYDELLDRCRTALLAQQAEIARLRNWKKQILLAAGAQENDDVAKWICNSDAEVARLTQENARLRKAFVRDFCWQFQDDAPGLRGECAEKIKQGKPCKDCPESWKEVRRDEQ